GGLLALSSNVGSHHNGQWAAVPEFQVRLACQLSKHMNAHVGYTLLYWPLMVRAADQIDLTINPNLIPPPTPIGPPLPTFTVRTQEIWAQGIDLGMEIRF